MQSKEWDDGHDNNLSEGRIINSKRNTKPTNDYQRQNTKPKQERVECFLLALLISFDLTFFLLFLLNNTQWISNGTRRHNNRKYTHHHKMKIKINLTQIFRFVTLCRTWKWWDYWCLLYQLMPSTIGWYW